ncbi:MAG: choice-of-anchor J domain-containing protein [Paludibacteraceae bacterium]|nr:choice-of-anchor J domain-containing protein [Paludibacteraceae bacterium]
MRRFILKVTSLLMVLCCCLGVPHSYAEDCITIGEGTEAKATSAPVGSYYGYERHIMLYKASDGITAGTINSLAWYYTSSKSVPVKIYLKNTVETEVPSSGSWNSFIADAELVYDATVTLVSNDWTVIDIDDFEYTGDNLMVLVASNYGGKGGGSISAQCSTADENSNGYYRVDDSIDDSQSKTFTTDANRANIQLCIEPAGEVTCAKPTGLAYNPLTLTATSATFSWTAGGEETEWQYLCIPAADAVDWDQSETTDENPLLVEELEPQTAYKFYLRAYCGDEEGQQSRVVSVAFTTPCEVITTLPKSFDFEAADALACWTVDNLQSPTSTSYIPSRSSSAKHNGSYGLELKAYKSSGTNADSAYAALPVIDWGANGIQKHTMSFYAKCAGTDGTYSKYNKHLYVYATDNLASFTLLKDIELTTSFEQYEIDFRNYVGLGRYIVFFATIPEEHSSSSVSYYGHFYIDDIEVFETPACMPLKSISISDVERRSFNVTLTPKDGVALGTYDLVCSDVALDNDALEIASKTVVSAASHVVSGLERDTKYYVYVRANCDADGVSTWVCDSVKTKALEVCDDYVQVGTGASSSSTYGSCVTRSGDNYGYGQTLYKASEIGKSGKIAAIAYNLASVSSTYTPNWIVYMGHTTASSLSSWVDFSQLTQVATITSAFEVGWNTIELSTAFDYNGTDNLIVAVANQTGSYSGNTDNHFYYTSESGSFFYRGNDYSSYYGDASNTTAGSASQNKADIKFSFCYSAAACPAIENLAANVLGSGATEEKISWTASAADFLSGYEFILSDTAIVAFSEEELAKKESLAADAVEKDLNGLTPETEYFVYLRAVCKAESHDEGESDWASVNFTTLANCPKVKDLDAALVGLNRVEIFWDVANEEQDTTFYYVLSDVQLDGAGIAAATRIEADSLHVIIDALDYDQDYWAYVASKCGASVSDYDTVHFKTLASCQAVVNLQATRIAHNLVELNWAKAAYATEAQWEVGIIGDESKKQIVSEPKAKIFGLEPETSYEAYVIALCSEFDHSDSTKVSFVTVEDPGNCQQVGDGEEETSYAPVYSYYKYKGYTQQLYTIEDAGAGNVISIAFEHKGKDDGATGLVAADYHIYMANTSATSLSSEWVSDGLVEVFSGEITFPAGSKGNWVSIPLTNPFVWDGSSNIVVAVESPAPEVYDSYFYATSIAGMTRYASSVSSVDETTHVPSSAGTVLGDRPNIQFCFEPKTCPDVKALAANDITKESAHISWEPMGSEVQWNVFLSDTLVEDFSAITSTVIGKLDTVFSGLSDDADYYAYVQPVCVGADSWAHVGFRTIASCLAQKDLGIAHEADSITAHTAKLVWTDPNAVRAGDYTVAYGLKDSIDFDKPASYQTLASIDTFALIGNLIPETEYQFAVKANCGGGDESRYSELSAAFKTAIGCFKPSSDPSVPDSTITATSAIVHWADEHDAPAYKVAYGLYDEFDINDESKRIIVDATDTFKLIEGLQPNTRYKVMVKSNCGSYDGESSWTWSEDFYTHCLAAELPFNEGFESADDFRCWTVGSLQSTNTSYIPYRYYSSSYAHSGSYALYFNVYGTSSDSAYAVLSELNIGANSISQYSISLFARTGSSSSTYNTDLYIGVVESPDDMSSLVIVDTIKNLTTTYAFGEGSLSKYAGTGKYIVLLAAKPTSQTYGYGQFYVDDIEVFKTPTCYPLKSMSFSEVERRSFKVTLSPRDGHALAAAHDLVCSTERLDEAGLEAAVKGTIAGADSIFSGLTRDTKYYIYARANCGSEDGVSAWIEDSIMTADLGTDCDGIEPVTVLTGDGSTVVDFTPWGSYYKRYHTQQIYTASELAAAGLSAGYISKVSFRYALSTSYTKTLTLYCGMTSDNSFAGTTFYELNEVAAAKSVTFASADTWYDFDFDTPFYWDGASNVVIGLLAVGDDYPGSGTECFYGGTTTGNRAVYSRADSYDPSMTSGTATTNRADIRFTICPLASACPAVKGLSHELVGDGTSEAIVRWNHPDVDYLGSYEAIISNTEITDFSGVVATHTADKDSIKFLGLTASTDYYVYVRTICDGEGHDDGQSSWSDGVHFRTLAACPAPVAPVATLKAADSVFVEWGISFVDQAKAFQYYLSDEELTESQLAALVLMPLNDTLSVGLGNLNPATDYHFYIRSICGGDYSPFAEAEFTTPVSCQKIVNLHSTNIAHNIIEVAWESAQFATETQWEVGIAGDESKKQIVNERSAKIFGLTPETAYPVYVKAICSATESSEEEIINLATISAPGACLTIGTGSSAQNDFPLAGWYHYSYTQQLYTAAELGHGAGDILSVAYEYMYSTSTTRNIAIYMANTDATSLSSAYVQDGFVEVLPAQNITFDNSDTWFSIDLTTPFAYTGGNLVVAVLMTKDAAESAYSNNSRFYAASSSGMSRYTRDDSNPIVVTDGATTGSGTAGYSRANMQFCFEDKACPDVTALSAGDVETHSAKISWTPMGSETAWRIILSDTAVVDFDAIAAVDIDTAYVLSYAFSGLDADKAYHAYVQPLCGGSDWSHVSFTTMPSCYAPSNLNVDPSTITSSGATLIWEDTNTPAAGSYIVAYGLASVFDLDDNTSYQTEFANDLSVVLSGLNASSVYKAAVKCDCGAEGPSAFGSVISFTTACGNITSLPWSENFNSLTSGIPNCWDNEEGTTTTASYKWNYYASGHDGACLRFNSYSNGSGNTNFLATPTIELSAAAELSFWCKNPAGGDYEVLISADGGEKESLLIGLTGISDWTEQTVDLSGYKGQAVVIYFKGTSNWGSDYSGCYLDLDDVQVTVKSGPTALDNVSVDADGVQKILLNDHLFIIREGVWYDAAGRRVEVKR